MNFRKITTHLAIISALCLSTTVAAQDLNFGAKAGLNIATLNFTDDTDIKSLLGLHVGVFGNYAINEKFAIQPELFYSTGGAKWSYSSSYDPIPTIAMRSASDMSSKREKNLVSGKIKSSYISLPIMFQYKVLEGLFVEAGPQYNFLLSIKEKVDGGSEDDIKETYKTGTFGYGVGLGYDLASFAPGLKVSARYTGDFSNMNSEEVGAGDIKSTMFQIGLSYAFTN